MIGLTIILLTWDYGYSTTGSSSGQRFRPKRTTNQVDRTLSLLILSLFPSFLLSNVQPIFFLLTFLLFISFFQWVTNDCFLTILVRVGPVWIILDRAGTHFRNKNLNIRTHDRCRVMLGSDISQGTIDVFRDASEQQRH